MSGTSDVHLNLVPIRSKGEPGAAVRSRSTFGEVAVLLYDGPWFAERASAIDHAIGGRRGSSGDPGDH